MGRKSTNRPKIGYNMSLLTAARLERLAAIATSKTGNPVDDGTIIEQLVNAIFDGRVALSIFTFDELKKIDQAIEPPKVTSDASTERV